MGLQEVDSLKSVNGMEKFQREQVQMLIISLYSVLQQLFEQQWQRTVILHSFWLPLWAEVVQSLMHPEIKVSFGQATILLLIVIERQFILDINYIFFLLFQWCSMAQRKINERTLPIKQQNSVLLYTVMYGVNLNDEWSLCLKKTY